MTHTAQIADATAHNVGNTFPPYPKLHARCDAPKATQLATSALTDACFRTTMLLRVRAGDMAAGALRCASAVYDGEVGEERDWIRRMRGDGGWWRALGFDAVAVEKAADEILGVLLSSDSTPPPVVVAMGAHRRGEG